MDRTEETVQLLEGLRDSAPSPLRADAFPETGAVYDVVLDTDTFVQWLVLYPPREDGWVLVAPVDLIPLTGRSDYQAPTELEQTIAVRASRSTWLWPELITGKQPVNRIEGFDLERVRHLAKGGLGPGMEDDAPELVEWNEELDKVDAALQRRLEQEAPEVKPIIPASVIKAWKDGQLSPEDAAKVRRYIGASPETDKG